jgi:hypothetical protein
LEEIRDNLVARIAEAEREGWLGEVEGLRVSLAGAEDKLAQMNRRASDGTAIDLGGLIPEFFRFGPMQDHFLGRSTNAMGPKTPVLGCECGEWGCWPLMARITATADCVTWDAFEQPHRKARDYVAFGPFQFDRHQYDDALQALSAVIGSDVDETRV